MEKIIDQVFFDCDSTLVAAEGIDMLAYAMGVGKEVEYLTAASMNGEVSFEEVFVKKVELVKPHLDVTRKIAVRFMEKILPEAPYVTKILQKLGKELFIVSAGFHNLVDPIAEKLGIPIDHVIANSLYFDTNGDYKDMSKNSPLCTNRGKAIIVEQYRKKYKTAAFVGDGTSDLAVKETVDLFIGFGGIIVRPKVQQNSDIYITESNLKAILKYILTPEEIKKVNI